MLVSLMVGCKSDEDDDTPSVTSYAVAIDLGIQHGSVTANPTSATAGTNVVLTATPADGYKLKTLTVKNASGGEIETTPDNSTPPKYKFTMPASNVKVSAEFEAVPTYTITPVLGIQNGSVSADKTSAAEGATVTLTATPATNYEFESFIVKDTSGNAITVTNGKFTMPASNVTISATFKSKLGQPLTLEAIEAGTITVTKAWTTLKYTKNGGALTAYSEGITVAANDIICFYAESSENTWGNNMTISCSSDCYVYGNIMSLVTLESEATAASQWNPEATTLTAEYAFSSLFEGNAHIKTTASKTLYLPATTLTKSCYNGMFDGCTSLTIAPELSATELKEICYNAMFKGCTSLTEAPELPATTLADYCYYNMFRGCTGLTTVPEELLPATTLAEDCYASMFYDCTNLTKGPDLPAATLVTECYKFMFRNCPKLNYIKCLATDISANNCTTDWLREVSASGTFVKAESMTGWTSGNSGIPAGWTVPEPERVFIWVNVPAENKPETVAIAGSFGDDFTMELLNSGWYFEDDTNFKALASDTFMFRDPSNHSKVLCKSNGEQAVFKFGDLWEDGSWKGNPGKVIEDLDLSDTTKYAWTVISQ